MKFRREGKREPEFGRVRGRMPQGVGRRRRRRQTGLLPGQEVGGGGRQVTGFTVYASGRGGKADHRPSLPTPRTAAAVWEGCCRGGRVLGRLLGMVGRGWLGNPWACLA